MKLDTNTSREVARKAILLNYINGSGRKLFSDIHEDIRNSPSGEKQSFIHDLDMQRQFKYLNWYE